MVCVAAVHICVAGFPGFELRSVTQRFEDGDAFIVFALSDKGFRLEEVVLCRAREYSVTISSTEIVLVHRPVKILAQRGEEGVVVRSHGSS